MSTLTPANPPNAVAHRLRRLVVSVALTTTALVGGAVSSADADVVTPTGASASTWFSCNPQLHTINYQVTIRPARRYTSQLAAYRIWIRDRRTGQGSWTAWDRVTAPNTTTYYVNMWNARGRYTMYMQYRWWNGRAWSYSGEWITRYTQQTLYGGYIPQSFCAV